MAIDNGDFVRVNFTGKIKETDEVFDTTYDEIAQEAGIFDENKTYKAIPIVVGGNHLLPAIEEAIIGLEEGETKHVEDQGRIDRILQGRPFRREYGRRDRRGNGGGSPLHALLA